MFCFALKNVHSELEIYTNSSEKYKIIKTRCSFTKINQSMSSTFLCTLSKSMWAKICFERLWVKNIKPFKLERVRFQRQFCLQL